MKIAELLQAIRHPKPEEEKVDTGLRFTDVLFGFVIKELFTRLANWDSLSASAHLQLIAGTTLVLGSWIGFRNSLHRSTYRLKFINLPLLRFVIDQLMLILYFRIAVLTPADPTKSSSLPADALANETLRLVVYVFILYVVWDCVGIWITSAETPSGNTSLYPDAKGNRPNRAGFTISLVALGTLAVGSAFADLLGADTTLVATTLVLLGYRLAKDTRTTWELLHPPT